MSFEQEENSDELSKEKDSVSIVLLGDAAVGKTSLVRQFTKQKQITGGITSIGIELHMKEVIYDNKKYNVKIWDTCGQERLRGITKNYLRSGEGLLLVYDISRIQTYESLEKWITDIKNNCNEDIPFVIAENKNDLKNEQIQSRITQLQEQYPNVPIFATTILDDDLVNLCFMELIGNVIEKFKKENNDIYQDINLSKDIIKHQQDKSFSCC